jgi:tight adherence protein B
VTVQALIDLGLGLCLAAAIVVFAWSLDTVRQERVGRELVLAPIPGRTARLEVWERFDRMLQPIAEVLNERSRRQGKTTLADELARAGLQLTSSEFLLIQWSAAGAMTLLGLLIFGFTLPMVVLGAAGMLAPRVYLSRRKGARQREFVAQLGNTLTLLSNALKTGYSLGQAIEVVARKAPPPVSDEFEQVVTSIHFGTSIEDALTALVRRVNSSDLDFIVVAILLHRKVGGNLAEILDNIGDTIRERLRMKRELSVQTAHARASATLISLLPLVLALLMFAITPRYFTPMIVSPLGWLLIVIAIGLVIAGNVIMRRFAQVDS